MVIGPGNQHFFVHELATTIEGKIVVPTKWIIVDGQLCGESWPVTEKVREYICIVNHSGHSFSLRTALSVSIDRPVF